MVVGEWRASARFRRADLGRRRVGPREERPAGDDEGRDEGERDDERYVGNIFVVDRAPAGSTTSAQTHKSLEGGGSQFVHT